jgi:hypothetical protein
VEHGTTLLLGLSGVAVERVELRSDGARRVHVATADGTAVACPACGVSSTSPKQNVTTRPKDLPYGEAALELRWHKRRWRCRESWCRRKTSPSRSPRCHPAPGRLRRACADAVEQNRCVDEVARSHDLDGRHSGFFVAALAGYFAGLDQPWWLVPLLLLLPDLFMAGYVKSHRAEAVLYNFAHSYPTGRARPLGVCGW